MKLSHPLLYFSVLAAVILLLLLSLGETVWGAAPAGELHWTEKMFFGICHQLPDRTYRFGEAMMAVNTRCFGIFAGIVAGWIFMPYTAKFASGKSWPVLLLLAAVVLQIADYFGNLVQLWENTNNSRALLGSLLGMAMSLSITDLFYKEH